MKIFVTGTRGIPDIPGGVEKHCQELYPRFAAMGHEVYLATRIPYVDSPADEWRGVRLVHIFCPRSKSLEAIVHTFLAILKAKSLDVDIIHIHAVGPGLMVPLARLLGLKVVVTNHGPDYDRQKWGMAARSMLRLGEYLGGRFAHAVIVISTVIADIIAKRCGRSTHLIYNGVPLPAPCTSSEQLEHFGIRREGGYTLAVARFVPEKGLHDLIEAFSSLDGDRQLVIAGDADHATTYSNTLRELASRDNRIVLTGYITGDALHQIYSHAGLFVLPSYHEGLPIVLLEAMSYGLPVLVSDIPANREVQLDQSRYFRPGDVNGLRNKLLELGQQRLSDMERQLFRELIACNYNWSNIAAQTIGVYEQVLYNKNAMKP